MKLHSWIKAILVVMVVLPCLKANAESSRSMSTAVREQVSATGAPDNALTGYGLVVGLAGTGDSRQTPIGAQILSVVLRQLGVNIPVEAVSAKNVATVLVAAPLPPSAGSGAQVDVTVSSLGDATSLVGGTLLLTSLHAADGQVYGQAQGALASDDYSARRGGDRKKINQPAAGRIPNGGLVERDVAGSPVRPKPFAPVLRDADFSVAYDPPDAIDAEFGQCPAGGGIREAEIKVFLGTADQVREHDFLGEVLPYQGRRPLPWCDRSPGQ
jgi:flagellar P-ring protein precursor FlgI